MLIKLTPGVNLSYPWATQRFVKSEEQFFGKLTPREVFEKADKIRRMILNRFFISNCEVFLFYN